MTKHNVVQNAFNAGEIGRDGYGRSDVDPYQYGCRTLENFLVKKAGGVKRRPGTIYEAPGDLQGRLIPFRTPTEHLLIYVTPDDFNFFRISTSTGNLTDYDDDGFVVKNDLSGPETTYGAKYIQYHNRSQYDYPLVTGDGPFNVQSIACFEQGGVTDIPELVSTTNYWIAVSGEADPARAITHPPRGPAEDIFIWFFANRNDAISGSDANALTLTGTNAEGWLQFVRPGGLSEQLVLPHHFGASIPGMTYQQEGDTLFFALPAGAGEQNGVWALEYINKALSLQGGGNNSRFRIVRISDERGPWIHTQRATSTGAAADVFWDEVDVTIAAVTRLITVTENRIVAPFARHIRELMNTSPSTTANEECAFFQHPTLGWIVGRKVGDWELGAAMEFDMVHDWLAAPPSGTKIVTFPNCTFWGTHLAWNRFGGPDQVFPYQGRLIGLGGQKKNVIYISTQGPDFSWAPLDPNGQAVATVAFEIDVIQDQNAEVVGLLEMRDLFLFTTSGVWAVDSQGALTIVDISAKQINALGASSKVKPIRVEQMLLYMSRSNDRLYAVTFKQRSIDDFYSTTDISTLSHHLLRAGIEQMLYQQDPHSSVWLRSSSDNYFVNISLVERTQINGWSRHFLGGVEPEILDMVAVEGEFDGGESWIYMNVIRKIDGANVIYIERMAPFRDVTDIEVDGYDQDLDVLDFNLLDCSKTGTVSSGGIITALSHLHDETVRIFYAGVDAGDRLVDVNGHVDVSDIADSGDYIAGYSYTSTLTPMVPVPPAASERGGVKSEGSLRKLYTVQLQLQNAMMGTAGNPDWEMEGIRYPVEKDALVAFNGIVEIPVDLGSEREALVTIQAEGPFPMEIDAIITRIDVQARGGE